MTNGVPFYYDYQNVENSTRNPSTIHVANTNLARFFKKYLLEDAISRVALECPQYWDRNYFLYVLFCIGYITICNTDAYGIIPQCCTLNGYNIFYAPANVVISNPLLRYSGNLRIGRDVSLIKLQPNYSGVLDLVDYYGDLMALASETMGTNLLNSKLAYVFTVENKSGAEAMKKLFDKVASGEPAVVQDKSYLTDQGKPAWQTFTQDIGGNFIAPDLVGVIKALRDDFLTSIGIPTANTEKKERLVTDEVNIRRSESMTKSTLWNDTLQEGVQQTLELFPELEGQFSIKLKEVDDYDEVDNVSAWAERLGRLDMGQSGNSDGD